MNHSFDIDLATEYGMAKAVLIENMAFWLKKNIANKKNRHDGFHWTYNTAESFAELFPYMNTKTIARHLKELEEKDGILKSSKEYNKMKIDRTKWYTIVDSEILKKYSLEANVYTISQNEECKSQNEKRIPQNEKRIPQNEGTIPDINSDINTDINSYIKTKAKSKKEFFNYSFLKETKLDNKTKKNIDTIPGITEEFFLSNYNYMINTKGIGPGLLVKSLKEGKRLGADDLSRKKEKESADIKKDLLKEATADRNQDLLNRAMELCAIDLKTKNLNDRQIKDFNKYSKKQYLKMAQDEFKAS